MDLWDRLAEDFSDEHSRWQMKRERQDRILEEDWKPGDWAALAKRYAAASHRVPAIAAQAASLAGTVNDAAGLRQVRELYYQQPPAG